MGNAARKARKRARQAAMSAAWTKIGTNDAGGDVFVAPLAARPFLHPKKVGTPVPLRASSNPFPHVLPSGKSTNSTSAAARRQVAEYNARISSES